MSSSIRAATLLLVTTCAIACTDPDEDEAPTTATFRAVDGMTAGACSGSTGEWNYIRPIMDYATCCNDVRDYCSSGRGSCSGTIGGTQSSFICQ